MKYEWKIMGWLMMGGEQANMDKKLEELTAKGWEIFSITPTGRDVFVVARRLKP